MLIDHGVVDGAEYDGDVENRVNHPYDVMSCGSLFFVLF